MEQPFVSLCLRYQADVAHFASIQTGSERMTLPVPTYSAAVGMVRALFGKVGVDWVPKQLRMFQRPKLQPQGFSELKELSTQENTIRNRILAHGNDFSISYDCFLRVEPDEFPKYANMLRTRLKNGSWHRAVSMGLREFLAVADVVEETNLPEPIKYSEDFGLTYFGQDWFRDRQAYLASLKIVDGVVDYPSWDEVRKTGIPYSYKADVA